MGMGVIRVRSGKGEKRATKLPDWESNPGLPRLFLEEHRLTSGNHDRETIEDLLDGNMGKLERPVDGLGLQWLCVCFARLPIIDEIYGAEVMSQIRCQNKRFQACLREYRSRNRVRKSN